MNIKMKPIYDLRKISSNSFSGGSVETFPRCTAILIRCNRKIVARTLPKTMRCPTSLMKLRPSVPQVPLDSITIETKINLSDRFLYFAILTRRCLCMLVFCVSRFLFRCFAVAVSSVCGYSYTYRGSKK